MAESLAIKCFQGQIIFVVRRLRRLFKHRVCQERRMMQPITPINRQRLSLGLKFYNHQEVEK